MQRKLLLLSMVALGSFGLLRSQSTPTADLLDVQFHLDGTATDLSPSHFIIENGSGTAPIIAYDAEAKKYVARFVGNSSSFFKVDYQSNPTFEDKIKLSFTLEVYAKIKASGTMDIVSSQQSGGFGFEQSSAGPTEMWFGYEGGSYTHAGNQNLYNATSPAYTHIVCTYDGTNLKMYYNGILAATTAPAGALRLSASAAAHWIAIGGDASTGSTAQSPFIGDISLVRMYSAALTATEITALYTSIEDRNSETEFNDLNTWVRSKLPAYQGLITDAGKKVTTQSLIVEGTGLMEAFTTTQTQINNFISKIGTQLSDLSTVLASDVLPRFAVISDTHVGNGSRDWNAKINKGLDILVARQPKLDAIFVCGDVTDWGTEAMYRDAKTIFSKAESALPVYYVCMGNHDWYDSEDCDDRFVNTFGQPLNQFVDIKGYPFILISMESSNQDQAYMAKTQQFLTDTLAYVAAHYPGKPIFMFMHVPVVNTVYGSYEIGGGDSWGSANIESICNLYPQIVLFSGHSHYPVGDPRSINQQHFTSINDGTMSYAEIETGMSEGIHPANFDQVTEGCLVSLQTNDNVEVKRWDLTRNEEIQTPWLIQAPFDGSHFTYQNRTGGAKPVFGVGAKPTVTDIKDNQCMVTYPQATDDEVVHHYKIQVLDGSGTVLPNPSFTQFSQFYLNSDMPASLSWKVMGLDPGTVYSIQVMAVDSYGNLSTPIISSSFTTNAYVPDPSVIAPDADLLDFKFKADSTGEDSSPLHLAVTKGSQAPVNQYDADLQQYVSVFKGNSNNFYKIDYQNNTAFKAALTDGFTLDVFVMSESTDDMCPVSSQESGGFGVEQAGGGGAAQLWMGVQSGGYTQVGNQPIYNGTTPAYVHLTYTYDGDSLKSYFNGVPGQKIKETSGLRFSDKSDAQWIAIGGDAHDGTYAQYAFTGKVALARIYDKALSRDEIVRLQEQIEARKAMTKVPALNELIAIKLPKIIAENPDALAKSSVASTASDLLTEGWALMSSLKTTDIEIQAFLDKASSQLGALLPVTLTDFKLRLTDKKQVQLSWNSHVEGQVEAYQVERSTDQIQIWQQLTLIKAKGDNNAYHYTDIAPAKGLNYYRIIEKINPAMNVTDQISGVLSIDLKDSKSDDIRVYPNPTSGIIHLEADGLINAKEIQVYTYSGIRMNAPVKINGSHATINLSGKAKGAYIIKYKEENFKVLVH